MAEALTARAGEMARDIKLAHSVFALPLALLAAFLAAEGGPGWGKLALVIACMVFARTFAMLANRYLDREIDAANPRTAGRALPAGRVRPGEVLAAMGLSGAGLIGAAALFGPLYGNWWPVILSPVVLGWLGAYGLAKRYTAACHFILGAALAMSPPAAALAIRPAAVADPAVWGLAGFVLLWVAGFDVIYALQDLAVDREQGLRSIPAWLGRRGALAAARAVHLGALVMLILAAWAGSALGAAFGAGVAVVGGMLILEHWAAAAGRFSMAFFTLNGVISLLLGVLGIADVLL